MDCTDAPNMRCFSWSNDVLQPGHADCPGDMTILVKTLCYLFGKYIIVPENIAL